MKKETAERIKELQAEKEAKMGLLEANLEEIGRQARHGDTDAVRIYGLYRFCINNPKDEGASAQLDELVADWKKRQNEWLSE